MVFSLKNDLKYLAVLLLTPFLNYFIGPTTYLQLKSIERVCHFVLQLSFFKCSDIYPKDLIYIQLVTVIIIQLQILILKQLENEILKIKVLTRRLSFK